MKFNSSAWSLQALAEQCNFGHDGYDERKICSRDYTVGQNIYKAWGFDPDSVGVPQGVEGMTGVHTYTHVSPGHKRNLHYNRTKAGT